MVESFPLNWPAGWPRTEKSKRQFARFSQKARDGSFTSKENISFSKATIELYTELDRLGAKNYVLSSNLQLGRGGIPLASQRRPEDVGVAIYFVLDGKEQCIPCDKWNRPEDNIRAIGKTIEALRGLDRWGAKEMVNAAFRGFQALPPGTGDGVIIGTISKKWFEVLGVSESASKDEVKIAFKILAQTKHPDAGGDSQEFQDLMSAYQDGMRKTQ